LESLEQFTEEGSKCRGTTEPQPWPPGYDSPLKTEYSV